MNKLKKNTKYRYLAKLLEEFNLLKSEEAMQETLEYIRFLKEQETQLQKSQIFRKMACG